MKGISEDALWIDEMSANYWSQQGLGKTFAAVDDLASDTYPNPALGKKHGLCHCPHCGWRGRESELTDRYKNAAKTRRRPIGLCPDCKQRPFWARLSKAQDAILAP